MSTQDLPELIKLGFKPHPSRPGIYYFKDITASILQDYILFRYLGIELPINPSIQNMKHLILGIYDIDLLNPDSKRQAIFDQITNRRTYQDNKFGPNRNHSFVEWCAILGEEVGEVNREALEFNFSEIHYNPVLSSNELKTELEFCEAKKKKYRHELIDVAAVAVAMIESLDLHHYPKI